MRNNKFNQAEADQLVAFFRGKGLRSSAELSRYIRTHNLKREWPHIVGNVQMKDRYTSNIWSFDGGISPWYFAYVCRELRFGANGKDAYVIDFTPYAYGA